MPGPGAPGLPGHACAGATGMPARMAARHRAGRLWARHPLLILLMGAAALGGGCTIFPQGAYWPPMARRAADGAAAEPRAPAARAGWLSGEGRAAAAPDEAAARQAALQPPITRRWSDEDLARSARNMSGWLGRAVYADAMQTVVWFYVEPVSYRRLVVAGLESLRAALENPTFRGRFPEAGDDARRARYGEALDILILKAGAADPWFAFQAADWLAVAMEKNRAMLGLPDGAVVGEFLFGAMDSLDPYSRYLTPAMLRQYREQLRGDYAGIGAEAAARGGRFFIRTVFEGGAAAQAGLAPGDEITAIAGQPVAGLAMAEVGRRLRGRPGEAVTVAVRPGGEGDPREVVLVRSVVHVPAVRDAQVVDAGRAVGYVRLAEFREGAEAALRRAIEGLAGQGARALVLDLRDNPGGELAEAVRVAGLFLPGGRVISTRGRMPGATWTYDVPLLERRAWDGPLAVLVDEGSASAAELVASALGARGRAAVVGRRTFGKGAVQILFPLEWGTSAVCLTMARVYDARGECLDGRGVSPGRPVAAAAAAPPAVRDDPAVRACVESFGASAK